ncbi:MAG: polyprenyl synthetase family protein [bacterium]|nr:polyprenyl synthetase family protein [bacterium]
MIKEFFDQSKKDINNFLKSYIKQNKKLFNTISPYWGQQLSKKLLDFSNQGKMIRGGLVLLGYQSFGKKKNTMDQIKIAAAMEIMHSSLLIHDDIMDRDTKRRGQITIHEFYKKLGKKFHLTDAEQFGLSTAICLGDIGFFLASDILRSIKLPESIKNKIINLFSQEIMKVGLAQQFEIFSTFSNKNLKSSEVLSIYKFKTARYTFSLPLKLGAISSRASQSQLNSLDKLGEKLGLIFQIQDDEIGIFGETKNTGKVVGSDVRENKKTLYYTNIFNHKKIPYQKELQTLYHKKNISHSDIHKIRHFLRTSGLFKKINSQKNKLYRESSILIKKIKTNNQNKKIYSELLEYNINRQK